MKGVRELGDDEGACAGSVRLARLGQSGDSLALSELNSARQVTPVIDRTYRFEEAPDALRHLGQGHARVKLVVTVA